MESRPWHAHYNDGVPVSIEVPPIPLDRLLRDSAQKRPDHPAVVFFGHTLTYGELDAIVDRFSAGLQELGLVPGDRVSIFMPNCPQAIIAFQGVWRAGGIAVPSNPLYTSREFAHQAKDAGSKIAVVLSMLYPRVKEGRAGTDLEHVIVTNIKEYFSGPLRALFTLAKERKGGHRIEIDTDAGTYWFQDVVESAPAEPKAVMTDSYDTALYMYTGGTTGVPKGAELTHSNMVSNAVQIQALTPRTTEGEEVMLTALPLTHSYSATVCMNYGLLRGYTLVVIPDPRDLVGVLKVIDKHRPTMFPGVPTLYQAIANHPRVAAGKHDLSSINYCISGAAGLPREVQERFQEVTGGRLVEGYGLSEASPVTHANPLDYGDRIGTIGLPLPGTDCRIVDEEEGDRILGPGERGVLCISGPQVMKGYHNMPEETAEALKTDPDGTVWLHTGDVAVMDEDGFFSIVDRKKDMILAGGGFNVYPREIEDVLYEHPKVAEAGVIGVPVDSRDQRAKAFIALKEGQEATPEEIIAFTRERLAAFKVPKSVEFRDELPKTFVGKILRRELMAEERTKQAGSAPPSDDEKSE